MSGSGAKKTLLALPIVLSIMLAAAGLSACDNGSSPVATPVPNGGGSSTPMAADPTRGQAVFARYCNACHPGGNQGAGPSLVSRVPGMSDAAIKNTVRHGKNRMPPFGTAQISDQELDDLVAYVRTLK